MESQGAGQSNVFRPWLQMAVFCEKVLHEQDGAISVIRVIDRFTVMGSTPEMANHVLQFTLLAVFKSGFMRGKMRLKIQPTSPSGKQMQAIEVPVLFEGDDDRGVATGLGLNFVVNEEGLYWFDLLLDSDLVTRLPLRVLYQQGSVHIQGLPSPRAEG